MVKRERSDDSDSPAPKKPRPETSTKPKSKPKSKGAAKPAGDKKMGPWSGDELKILYNTMCPKRTGVNWNEVAQAVGARDAKSCQNKWARMQGKIMEAITSLGE